MKKLKLFVSMLITAVILVTGCEKLDPELTVNVDGQDIYLDCTVQDILDKGFNIGEYNSAEGYIDPDDYPVIEAGYLDNDAYYILGPDMSGKCLRIRVYNPNSTDVDLSQCQVYEIGYDVSPFYSDSNPNFPNVQLNGADFNFTDTTETVDTFIEQGFKFKSSDSTSFCEPNVYGCSVLGAEGLYGHHLTLFRDYNYNDNTVRMSGFEISLQLEYDFV